MAGNGVLGFIEWAREEIESVAAASPGWSWMMSRVLSCCKAHPRGVTRAILLAELFQAWSERERVVHRGGKLARRHPVMEERRKRRRHLELGNAVSIDYILEKKYVALDAAMEVVVLDIHVLPGTGSYLLTLGDMSSRNTIDHYLHQKFYDMIQGDEGIIRKGRSLRMTGCRLRVAPGSSAPRLLPTEYLIVLLEEEEESDKVLLATRFFSATFPSTKPGTATDLYVFAKLEKSMEVQTSGDRSWRSMVLADSTGCRIPLVLWNDQVPVANLLSEGIMLALERPFVGHDTPELRFEFGTCTRLYGVPCVLDKQANIETGSSETLAEEEACIVRNTQGASDLKNFPSRILIKDLRPKMFNVALYGTVVFLGRSSSAKCDQAFLLSICDDSGKIEIGLQFMDCWSFGELYPGQLVFISGLATFHDHHRRLKCSWTESEDGRSFFNVSRLTAIMSSPCLRTVVPISEWCNDQVCRVRLGQVNLQLKRVHAVCGRQVEERDSNWLCLFCESICDQTSMAFHLKLSFSDILDKPGSEITSAIADGEAAFSLVQVSPERFCTWPEDDQVLYAFSLIGEEFLVSFFQDESKLLKISSAVKCSLELT